MNGFILAIGGMASFGLFWGVILAICNKVFFVAENPLVEKVVEELPGANCGACGFAGCQAFGEALAENEAEIGDCPVCSADVRQWLAKALGREVSEPDVRTIAVLHCDGTLSHSPKRAEYFGYQTCTAEHLAGGGSKACTHGCLGLGDCVNVCPFDALIMGDGGLPVVIPENCTACGKCVTACPRSLFQLLPENQKAFVLCSSQDPGVLSKNVCEVSCIACKICVKQGGEAFSMDNNVAVIDPEKIQQTPDSQIQTAIDKCPRNIIRSNPAYPLKPETTEPALKVDSAPSVTMDSRQKDTKAV